jgi:galactokinase
MTTTCTAFAPGRVNLIGEHVDYAGGPVLPMAIELGTTIVAHVVESPRLVLRSDGFPDATVPLPVEGTLPSGWEGFVAAAARALGRRAGADLTVTSTLPIGAGLSSSSSFTVAALLALGDDRGPLEVARAASQIETEATGVPGGLMDQVAATFGVDGHALLVDCTTFDVEPVPLPDSAEVVVVHSGQSRILADSAYAERRASVEAAAERLGPLPGCSPGDERVLDDPVLRRRARHVITECARVRAVAASPADLDGWRDALAASHASLRDDFDVSTPALDATVDHLVAQPGVIGARLTGAGFGGCVVALVHRAAEVDLGDRQAWRVRPSAGATVSY